MFKILQNFLGKLITDILRDKDSTKFSVTKTIAIVSFLILILIIITALYIMITNREIDHFLIAELILFILTLLGFKNLRRVQSDKKKVDE